MTRLIWGAHGERLFETGIDRGVLFVGTKAGVAWNGITAITEKTGSTLTPHYYDGFMYLNAEDPTDFAATLQAFSYPKDFSPCLGDESIGDGLYFGLQPRKQFGLSYRTLLGNDAAGLDYGYKLHFVYNAKTASGDRALQTVGATTTPSAFSWELVAKPVRITNRKATAHLYIDSTKISKAKLTTIENILYGTATKAPRLPTPSELITIAAS